MATPKQIIHAYRNLYRQGLRAVRHAKPARYTLRDRLRTAFRNSPASTFSAPAVANTLLFLQNAAAYAGTEKKVVKNLLYVWATREEKAAHYNRTPPKHAREDARFKEDAYAAFDRDLDMLNRTLGTCIK